jgi:hypothetical protein
MKDYIEFGNRIRNIMETECADVIEEHGGYAEPPPESYKLSTGKSYYTYHPFVMERIPAYFAYINNIKIRHYMRLYDSPAIKNIESDYKVLLIYVYEGNEINLKNFLKTKHGADCYYVFNTEKPHDVDVKNYIIRNRPGLFEGWSDVILNINKDKYDFFIFANDRLDDNLVSSKDWIKILIEILNYHPPFLQFSETQFIVNKIALDILVSCAFHCVIRPNTDPRIILNNAIREISLNK